MFSKRRLILGALAVGYTAGTCSASAGDSDTTKHPTIKARTITLPIDHFSGQDTKKAFENRFWVTDAFYRPNSPVFIFDIGEDDAESLANTKLGNSSSASAEILKTFNAFGIVWEHRYVPLYKIQKYAFL